MAALAVPGRSCWRRVEASRLGFLVDGSAFYPAFAEAVERARHSVLIAGWDIHSKIPLRNDGVPRELPDTLAAFLDAVVRRQPGLHIHLLLWDFAMLYALEREPLPLFQLGWKTHRRVHFRLDDRHPLGACRHQKLVVVDDRVAFLGGFDLTGSRWDTPAHRPDDPQRRHRDGNPYPPFHDVQAVVEGEAAATLGELLRERWRHVTGKRVARPRGHDDPWPPSAAAALTNAPVALSRTEPAYDGAPEVREVERLLLDAVASARGHVFFETQYFTSETVADALGAALSREDGPEVVGILPAFCSGWLEEKTMGSLRSRLLRRLRAQDRHGRLRCWYPFVPGLGDMQVNVHSKILEVDGTFLTIGSANLSNRSMGFDAEVNLAVEAEGREDAAGAIAGLRHRLLAEHLGTTPQEVAGRLAAAGSLVAAVEGLRREGRTLLPLEVEAEVAESWSDGLLAPDTPFLDPERPVELEQMVQRFALPEARATEGWGPLLRVTLVLALLVALAAVWRFTPLAERVDVPALLTAAAPLRESRWAPLLAPAAFVVGGLLMIPVLVLIVACAGLFGAWAGFAYALSGSLLSAFAGYGLGRLLGRDAVRRLAGSRLDRVSHRLSALGVLAVAAVRLVPVAPFTIVNLIAGAVRIRPRPYLLGTLLGMLPGIALLTLFGHGLVALMARPTAARLLVVGVAAAGVIGVAAWLRRVIWRGRGA
jgi:phospholipase D1/2